MNVLTLQLSFKRLIIFGVIIRILLMPFIAHPFDVYQWYTYVTEILNNGVSLSFLGINPVWKILLVPIAFIYDFFSKILNVYPIQISTLPEIFDPSYGISVITDPVFNFIIKIPIIIADILSALLIYRLAFFFTQNKLVAKRSAILYFFSPIVIWISAAWGQYDSLAVFLSLFSFYLLLVKKKYFISSIILYLATLVKIYPIIFLVPIIISIIRFDKNRKLKIFYFLIPFIPLVFYELNFQGTIISFIQNLLIPNVFFFTSGFGLTYWSVSLLVSLDSVWSGLLMNMLLLFFFSLSLYYIVIKTKTRFQTIIVGSFLFTSAFFLSLPFIFEQRSLMLLSLFSLVIIFHPSSKKNFILLSFIAFLFSQKNFPFYLLPLASRFPNEFSIIFSNMSNFVVRTSTYLAPTNIGASILFIIGTIFSIILLLQFFVIFKQANSLNNYDRREKKSE